MPPTSYFTVDPKSLRDIAKKLTVFAGRCTHAAAEMEKNELTELQSDLATAVRNGMSGLDSFSGGLEIRIIDAISAREASAAKRAKK